MVGAGHQGRTVGTGPVTTDRDLAKSLADLEGVLARVHRLDFAALHSLAYSRHTGGDGTRRKGEVSDAWVGDQRAKDVLRSLTDAVVHAAKAIDSHRVAGQRILDAGEKDDSLRGTLLGDERGNGAKAEMGRHLKNQRKRRPPWSGVEVQRGQR